MPAYGAAVGTVQPGYALTVWNAETVPATGGNAQISAAVGLRRDPYAPHCFSVEVDFAADPGTFSIELQTADTDADANYVTKTTLAAVNAAFNGRLEITNVVAKFARLRMATKTNAVAVTARFF